MSTRLALRIQQRFEKLAPSERKLATLVLERQDDLLTYSATELAAFAGVSKATAARLFRNLGYSDFGEVRLQAREERNRTAPFERKPVSVRDAPMSRSIGTHLEAELASLTRTFEQMRSDRVSDAADVLAEAPRLWLLGLGLEEGLARYGRLLLARLRPDVQLLGAQGGGWGEDLAMTGAGDALVVLSVPPRPRVMGPLIDYARTSRMAIVALVDPSSAPWARRFARVTLECHGAAGSGPGSPHMTLLSTLNLLADALAGRLGRGAAQRAELLAEIHEELDDEE